VNLHDELRPTADCIPLDRIGEPLTDAAREHVRACSRCESELALFREFESGETSEDEQRDVSAIVGRLRSVEQPRNVVSFAERKSRLQPRVLAVAAMLILVVAIGYLSRSREEIGLQPGDTYRSSRVEGLTPGGDVSHAPNGLSWMTVAGATDYDVQVVEVDRTILWRVSTRNTRVELPPAVVAQLVPGKTVLWQVTARRGGTVVAESEAVKIRVVGQ